MKNSQPKSIDIEQIDIDNRDADITNITLNNSVLNLIYSKEPIRNRYGHTVDDLTRFVWVCNLTSYITEGALLNRVIEYLKINFKSKAAFKDTEDYLNNIKELYSTEDFIKLKAIYFSIRAKYMAVMETFNSQNSPVPTFEIHLTDRIIIHNFPLVERSIFRNFEIEYKESLKKIPPEIALEILNKRMELLRDLDFLYDTKISSKIIKYHKNTEKMLVAKYESITDGSHDGETLLKNQFKKIFRDDFAFTLFMKMKDIYRDEPEKQQANYSNLFDIMKKEGSVICTGVTFKDFLSSIDIHITKIDTSKTGNKIKTQLYNSIKDLLKKSTV